MRTIFLLLSILAAVAAFNSPMMATRAVGKTAPKAKAAKATKAVKAPAKKPAFSFPKPKPAATKAVPAKKAAKKAAPTKKVAAKKAPVKKVVAKKAPTKKVVAKKAPTKKVVAKKAPVKKTGSAPQSQGYPSFDFTTFKPFSKISGGGNRGPTFKPLVVPNFSDPKLQIKRDPAFYAAAAATRQQNIYGSEFVFDDGLTEIERTQQKVSPKALSGAAKEFYSPAAIDTSIEPVSFFGLSADRFQLLFIAVFGLFTLVGSLSGRLQF